jgi:hypothetical protein
VNPRVCAGVWAGVVRADEWWAGAGFGCSGSGGLFWLWLLDLVEGDGVAERFELAL